MRAIYFFRLELWFIHFLFKFSLVPTLQTNNDFYIQENDSPKKKLATEEATNNNRNRLKSIFQ